MRTGKSGKASRWMPAVVVLAAVLATAAANAQNGVASSAGAEPFGRLRIKLEDQWRFVLEDVAGGQGEDLDDSGWQRVALPHTWNSHDPFDDEYGYYRGIGWYRRWLRFPSAWRDRQLTLYFHGVNQTARVYVNGREMGVHRGGFSAFAYDITDEVRWSEIGGEALLAVKVDNRWDADVPPISTLNFITYGGIYRDVYVVVTDKVHLSLTDHASSGVYIDASMVNTERAVVQVRGLLENHTGEDRSVRVVSRIEDPDGRLVAQAQRMLRLPAGKRSEYEQGFEPVPSPQLWSPESPSLYALVTEVYEGRLLRDRLRERFGFRWFRFDPARGFFLNGRHVWLKGTNRHQDWAGLGNALPTWRHVWDVRTIRAMGANFLRLAHYPQDEVVLDTADEVGLLLWEEIPVVTRITASQAFAENSLAMLEEMIKQHYNHPSVILWGFMNEPLLRNQDEQRGDYDPEYVKFLVGLARRLDARIRELDPSRATVMAIHASSQYAELGMHEIPDVLGWNRYDGWYGGSIESFGRGMVRQHEQYPRVVQMISEFGAGSDDRLNTLAPERMDFSVQYQQEYLEGYFRQFRELGFLAGAAVWSQFDFGNPYNQDTIPAVNQKGLLTFDRRFKDVYWLFQANFSEEPVLRIATREWAVRTGTNPQAELGGGPAPVSQPVKVYSNLASVELRHNGRSLEAKRPDEVGVAVWSVPFVDGLNVLEAVGEGDGRELRDRTTVEFRYRASVLADPSAPFQSLAVNAGSHMQFRDGADEIWEADQPYAQGGWGFVGGEPRDLGSGARRSDNIEGTSEDPLYQRYRHGLGGYRFDVPDGRYEIELRFVEYEHEQPGERVFDVAVNGVAIWESLDVCREVGFRHALRKVVQASVSGGRGVQISFAPIQGEPVLCGVRLERLSK